MAKEKIYFPALIAAFLRSDHPLKSHLKTNDRILLIALASFMNEKNCCWPSYEKLMDFTGFATRKTIPASLKKFKQLNMLDFKKVKSNRYFFTQWFLDEMEILLEGW